jgi:hypothetical protein
VTILTDLFDNSARDGTNDEVNGSEVDANPNTLANILDGTTTTDLAQSGTVDFLSTSSRVGLRSINLANAAGSVYPGFTIEWDPADSANLTDNSSGIGLNFIMPDSVDNQDIYAALNVLVVADDTGSEEGEFSFNLRKGGTVTEIATLAPTTGFTLGVNDTGYDMKLFGATSGSFMLWDESADSLLLTDSTPLKIGDSQDLTLYHDGTNSYITNAVGALKLATETSGIAVTIGHTTSEVTVADNLTVTGVATLASLICTAGATFGGGIGSTGVTISTAGVIQANGAITSDGAVTGATLAGTISTATQNSITAATALASVGTVTSGTWSTGAVIGGATMTLGSDATGDVYYRNASAVLTRLAVGSDADVLTLASGVPSWATPTVGDITGVTAGVGLSGGGTSGSVTLTLDLSELSAVTPTSGDSFSTLDNDGANEQRTTTDALATLFSGTGLTASSAVIGVDASQTQITGVGTITTGTWNATVIASVYLDADTAHLSGTQTFSGAKTFGADLHVANGQGVVIGHTAQITVGGIVPEFQMLGTGHVDTTVVIGKFSNDAIGPALIFLKSRATSISATPTSGSEPDENDTLGHIGVRVDDSNDFAHMSSYIEFAADGDFGENDIPGRIAFYTATDASASLVERMRIDSSGTVNINDITTNADMTVGLTINQGGNGDHILTFKSSEVSHGVTSQVEQDTYGYLKKRSGSIGGLMIVGIIETGNQSALYLQGVATDTDTGKTAGDYGVIRLDARVKAPSGTTSGAVGADGNLLSIDTDNATRFIFDAEGSGHADVEWVAFAEHDDIALVSDMETALLATEENYQTENRHYLEQTGIIGKGSWHTENGKPRAMINFTKLSMLHHGALIQIGDRFISNEERIDYQQEEIESLKKELRLLKEAE